MVGRQSVRKKKRFRNKSRNKNVRKMRQIGGHESFSFTDKPLTFWERVLGRQQKQLSPEEMFKSIKDLSAEKAKRDAVAAARAAALDAERLQNRNAESRQSMSLDDTELNEIINGPDTAAAAKETAEKREAAKKAGTPPGGGGSNRRKSKKSKKSRKSKTRHKKNKKITK